MAQQKVVDLVVQRGSLQIVQRVQTTTPARKAAPDLRGWLVRSPASWRGLAAAGLASSSAGVVLGLIGHRMLTLWFANSLLSAGMCLLFLGLLKRLLTPAAPGCGDPGRGDRPAAAGGALQARASDLGRGELGLGAAYLREVGARSRAGRRRRCYRRCCT
jgi:hypothetical protein